MCSPGFKVFIHIQLAPLHLGPNTGVAGEDFSAADVQLALEVGPYTLNPVVDLYLRNYNSVNALCFHPYINKD
jgi:hypothetical protein